MTRLDPELHALVEFRSATADDMAFVLDSWLKSFRTSPWAGVIPNNLYHEVTQAAVNDLIVRGARIIVAGVRGKPDRILGWVCVEALKGDAAVCHYLYVKDPYRRRGLGTHVLETGLALLNVPQDCKKFHTFRTRLSAHFPEWRHEPAIARRK